MLNFCQNLNYTKNNIVNFCGNYKSKGSKTPENTQKQDFYTKSDAIRFPKDAFQYINKKLPQTDDAKMLKYLCNTAQMLCDGDEDAEILKELIDFISENDLSENIIYDIPDKGGLNSNIKGDLADIKITGKDFIPNFKDDDEALEYAETGDVFSVEGEKFAKIKTNDGEIKRLKISPKTYSKLFPKGERFMMNQGFSGDCFLLSALNSAFDNPKTRYNVLSAFAETEDGVDVKFPNGENKIFFKDCEFGDNIDTTRLSTGCLGLRMLEHLYGYEMVTDRENEGREILGLDEINENLEDWCPKYKCVEDYYRENNGNKVSDAFCRLGLDEVKMLPLRMSFAKNWFSDALSKPDGDKIIIAAPDADRHLMSGNELRKNHAYQIKPYKTNEGIKYRVINSSNSAFYADMGYDEIMENFKYAYIINTNPVF